MKIPPVAAELLQADRRTDRRTHMTKRIVAFCNFSNAFKNGLVFPPGKHRKMLSC